MADLPMTPQSLAQGRKTRAQAAQIERLQAALRDADRRVSTEPGATWEEDYPMLNEGDMDDGRKLRRQAAQIERVREVLAWVEQAENRAYDDWTRTADTHHRDAALAYTQAATWLRYALGDNDE